MVNINYKGLKLNVKNVNGTLELEIKNNEGVHDCLLFITSEGVGYSKYNKQGTRIVYTENTNGEKLKWEHDSEGNLLESSEDGIPVE
jgi:hypothetical protein